jgi:hypothetical protein
MIIQESRRKLKIVQASKDSNICGLNIPMVKDPKTGLGSVSLTLLFISSIIVVVGLVGKWSGYLAINLDNALEFFYAASALYFGRKWVGKTGNTVDSETISTKPNP